MTPVDNKAIFGALIIIAWILIDYSGIKDPALINTLQGLLIGLGVFHAALSTPGDKP